MLMLLRRFITHNWILKLFSLLLAGLMWFAISSENNTVINHVVPLGFQGLPRNMEITHETARQLALTLRGSASLLAELSNADITAAIPLAGEEPGHKSVLLSADYVQKPFGVEVLRIDPNRVQFDLERTLGREIPVYPNVEGAPAEGYTLGKTVVVPEVVEVTGPESSIQALQSLSTLSVRIDGATASIRTSVDLDVRDPLVRLPSLAPVEVHVEILEVQAQETYRVPADSGLADWDLSSRSLDLTVSGPVLEVESFDPESLYFTFETSDLAAGGELVPRIVGLPNSFTVVGLAPETLRVSPPR